MNSSAATRRRSPSSSLVLWCCLLACAWESWPRSYSLEAEEAFAASTGRVSSRRIAQVQAHRSRRAHAASRAALPVAGHDLEAAASVAAAMPEDFFSSISTAFADQGFNINGILFQASLPLYLLFLYFLNYRRNNTPPLAAFGFAFLLVFVGSTIPAGIISKSAFGVNLADSDWLHGAAESLLTCTNILIVLGFSAAMNGNGSLADSPGLRSFAGNWFIIVALALATGQIFGLGVHSQFLSNAGGLPELAAVGTEPVNALSLPTWLVHWSTVLEWLVAMSLVWRYAEATGNEKWKGLSWGMYLNHASSVFAITYHIFYNNIGWILTGQALCTCLGNATLMVAAYRIAVSNGWTVDELNPFAEKEEADMVFETSRLKLQDDLDRPFVTISKLIVPTIIGSYVTKYGELFVAADVFRSQESNLAAVAVVLAFTSGVVYTLYNNSEDLKKGEIPRLV